MEGFDEFIIKNKTDLEKVSTRATVLKIHYPIKLQDALIIMKNCRNIREIQFEKKAFERTDQDAKQFLDKYVYLDMF
ncbi:TPA: hypothetical protein H1012_01945 [archaeon]|nr:hypothetical protein [Candidatus Naiadarchaeales archaeon SRR2090153.bin461]HIK02587.1 hypothetical protein [Candidatus Naiadarchaeales archaeon SRR2090159.bin1288]